MGPTRKSRSINKRFSYVNESSPNKDGDKQKIQRKRKLSDMLGPQWSKEELECFYEAYRKHGKDWKKVAAVIQNRSVDMVEAVYSLNRAYLSLPEGTASVAGFYAMMTDYYTNMEERDSEQESNDGAGTSRKPQKRIQGKAHAATSKGSVGRLALNPETAASSYGCLSLLKKKRSGGSRPRAVGKRTPRFPVSYSYENINGKKYYSPSRKGVTLRAGGNDDEVAHEIALALAEASQRGGSPQVSQTPNRITDSIMSSPAQSAERIVPYDESELTRRWFVASDAYGEDIEGSMEADNEYLVKGKSYLKERSNTGSMLQNGKGTQRKHMQIDKSRKNHLEDIREACSGTEGQRVGTGRRAIDMEVADAKTSRSSSQGPRKRSKKVLFRRDETSEFDALETLANLSLMLPQSTNKDDSAVQLKDENDDLVDESPLPQVMSSRQREKRKSSAVSMTGKSISRAEFADNKTSKSGKQLGLEINATQEELESHQSTTRASRKKQKIGASIIPKVEAQIDTNRSESLEAEPRDARLVPVAKSKCTSQSSSPQLVKHAERDSSSTDHGKEPNYSAMSAVHASVVNQVNLPTKVRSRRKMLKPQILEDVKFSDLVGKEKPNLSLSSVHDSASYLKEKLSHSLLNQRMRRWCAFEWFYSAIDYPWFAKREFVEYLNHVGLGHVPRLTRVEWGVIRSSLGKPRRFSAQFLKEEKEKLNQYRESVRRHYTELRSGTREGLPTDLARPLSVGQRVIAIYPRTREIHDGSVLTVDHNRCRVQFDRPELGVAFVMDVDCMPLNPLENMPTSLVSRSVSVDNKFFEGLNELQMNARAKDQRLEDYMKLSSREKLENADDTSHLSPPIYPLHDALKQAKVAPINADLPSKAGIKETGGNQQTAYSQPGTLAQIQAKEADVLALAELTRALDKKEAVVCELKRMNDDVFENQKDGNATLKDSDAFKKQYAAVLVQLNEANAQVSSALYRLRQRNTYQGNFPLTWPRPGGDLSESGGLLSSLDHTVSTMEDSECNASEIVESSRIKSRAMVDIAIQALSSLKVNRKVEVDEAVNYVNDRLQLDGPCMPSAKCSSTSDPVHSNLVSQEQSTSAVSPTQAPDLISRDVMDKNKTPIPSELISHCVTTLFVIQKCTERQFPPADVARILDSAVSSLKPCSSQNLPVYAEIQKCMGIIKNQILALVPT